MRTRLHFRGFTLIEMMTVVVILAVLTTVAAFSYKRYIRRARTLEGVSVLMDIKLKQETHFMTYSSYVTTGCSSGSAEGCTNPSNFDAGLFYPADSAIGTTDAFLPETLPVKWKWNCATTTEIHELGFCALGVAPGGPETSFQYVTVGWRPCATGACFDPTTPLRAGETTGAIQDAARRWWFARARTYPDGTAGMVQELRLSSELSEIVELNYLNP